MAVPARSRVLSQADVRVSSAPVVVGHEQAGAHTHSKDGSEVSIQRDAAGDVVEIRVRCACGESTIINCRYEG